MQARPDGKPAETEYSARSKWTIASHQGAAGYGPRVDRRWIRSPNRNRDYADTEPGRAGLSAHVTSCNPREDSIMVANQPYVDRYQAGEILADALRPEVAGGEVVVVALPRGGVPVGLPVARALEAPLDFLLVQKLGVPGDPELAMGAISACGFEILDDQLVASLGLTPLEIAAIADRELFEMERREALYRHGHPAVDFRDRVVVIVDDGLATGLTMRAAVRAVRACGPGRIIAAAPVGAPAACRELAREVGVLVCPLRPEPFDAVGRWYHEFAPTGDDEVCECLARSPSHDAVCFSHA